MTLDERITAAISRITSGMGSMRIPADETDPDLVLAACRERIAELEAAIDAAVAQAGEELADDALFCAACAQLSGHAEPCVRGPVRRLREILTKRRG